MGSKKHMRIRSGARVVALEYLKEESQQAKAKAAADGPAAKGATTVSIGGLSVVFEVLARHLKTPSSVTKEVTEKNGGKKPSRNKTPALWDPGFSVTFRKEKGRKRITGAQVWNVSHGRRGGICTLDSSRKPIRAIDFHKQEIEMFSHRRQVIKKHIERHTKAELVPGGGTELSRQPTYKYTEIPPQVEHNPKLYPTERQFVRYGIHSTKTAFEDALKEATTERKGKPIKKGEFRAQRIDVRMDGSNSIIAYAIDGEIYWSR
jgi:hypothetical protein